MTIGQVIAVDVCWIIGMILIYHATDLLDKKMEFLNHSGWNDLGRAIVRLVFLVVPPIGFCIGVLTSSFLGAKTVLIAAGVILASPVIYYLVRHGSVRLFYPPKRMAAHCRRQIGEYDLFDKKYPDKAKRSAHPNAVVQDYVWKQIYEMQKKLGLFYRWGTRAGKEAYVSAILEKNKQELPQIKDWEYHAVLEGLYRATTNAILQFDVGENMIIWLHWKKDSFTPEELTEEDRRKYFCAEKFRNVTMTGRLIYLFECIERYLVSKYPDRDWTIVARRLWNRAKEKGQWSEGMPGDSYREIVPERIMRFMKYQYGYDRINSMVFQGKLSEEVFTEVRKLYDGIFFGEVEEEINQIMKIPEQCMYQCDLRDYRFGYCDQVTIESIISAESILEKNGIPLPEFTSLQEFSFERSGEKEENREKAFGFGVDATRLSIILKEH
ncbi:MAG: hypothetical protein IK081_00725 [Lachnospiraceae bacterium]|nr:hypothetical protein [Lachnospiraceae bacterium]